MRQSAFRLVSRTEATFFRESIASRLKLRYITARLGRLSILGSSVISFSRHSIRDMERLAQLLAS